MSKCHSHTHKLSNIFRCSHSGEQKYVTAYIYNHTLPFNCICMQHNLQLVQILYCIKTKKERAKKENAIDILDFNVRLNGFKWIEVDIKNNRLLCWHEWKVVS